MKYRGSKAGRLILYLILIHEIRLFSFVSSESSITALANLRLGVLLKAHGDHHGRSTYSASHSGRKFRSGNRAFHHGE